MLFNKKNQKNKDTLNKYSTLIKEILHKEAKENNINIDIVPITLGLFLKSAYNKPNQITKKRLKKRDFKSRKTDTGGAYFYNDNVLIVFIDNILNRKIIYDGEEVDITIEFLKVAFHEFKHALQSKNEDQYSFENFMYYIESILSIVFRNYYMNFHERFYTEIDAERYGYIKTIEYLKNNDINLYNKNKEYLIKQKNVWEAYFKNYMNINGFEKFYTEFLQKIHNDDVLALISENSILNTFINKKGSYRKIEDILYNPNFDKIDEKIIYLICTSDSFRNYTVEEKENLSEIEKEFSFFMLLLSKTYNEILKDEKISVEQVYNEVICKPLSEYKNKLKNERKIQL